MSWNYVFGSATGTSHVRTHTRCQDEVAVTVERLEHGEELIAIFVSDGAGSAREGGTGAELVVQASLEFIGDHANGETFALDAALARDLLGSARVALERQSKAHEIELREFACTYLALLSAESLGTLVVHLGDGGLVMDLGNGLECRTEPMNGEYANSTLFVTDAEFDDLAQVATSERRVQRVAVFTDGLQSLGVDLATNAPHMPFFRPFFAALESTAMSVDGEHALQGALDRFLNSDIVNERTDDDKSLAVAVWSDAVQGMDGVGE